MDNESGKIRYDTVFELSENTRRKPLEDYILVDNDKQIYIVADGYKGHREKDIRHAYEIAAHYALDFLRQHLDEDRDMKELLEETKVGSNNKVEEESSKLLQRIEEEGGAMPRFGETTLEVHVIKDDVLYSMRVGDGVLKLVMEDGSIETPFDEKHALDLLESGDTNGAESRLYNQTTSHIGEYKDPPPSEYKAIPLEGVRNILIGTDGLQYLNNKRIKDIILSSGNLQDAVSKLVEEARTNPDDRIARIVQREEPGTPKEKINDDDISAIIIQRQPAYIEAEPEPKEPEIIVADMQAVSSIEEIAGNAQKKASELKNQYKDYVVRYNWVESGSIINSQMVGFGEFLSREYEKINIFCSELENHSGKHPEDLLKWYNNQKNHVNNWIRTSQRKGLAYKKEALAYRESLEGLYNTIITRCQKNVD